MIKNCAKGLMALLCVVGLSVSSCKKDMVEPQSASVQPDVKLSETMLATTSVSSLTTSGLSLGINGHPFGDAPYLATPASTQIGLLNQMKMNWYRINVLTTSDGTISASSSSLFSSLQEAAASGAVNLLPMLYTRTLSFSDSPNQAYQKGKTIGANFAAKYGQYFTYYDLGNDLELDLKLPNTTGRNISDFDAAKSAITAAYLKGMDEGIKANDADAKTMIDAGWLHWGFLNICKNSGVKFDAIGYHWYSDMEGAAKSFNITDITVTLSNLFTDKELWFTEFGYRYKATSLTNELDQNTFMNMFINKCKNNSRVKAAIAYELFDEPYKKGNEGQFGVYKWTAQYTTFAKKTIADGLLQVVQPVQLAVQKITGLTSYTTNKPQMVQLTKDGTYYMDRDYKITSLPTYLSNSTLVKTANSDKTSTLNSVMSFTLTRSATVYIAYDPRASKIPTWLQGFTKVTDKLGINDEKLASMQLYKKDFPAGTVTLGGNLSGGAQGALCHYVLMVA